jgi:hypothetical protein
MNNSLPRLIDGMIATLRGSIIPQLEGEFARGQAYGLIYMLNSIRLRADWSPSFLGEQLAALDELAATLTALGVDHALPPGVGDGVADSRALEALRDAGEQQVCALIDWLEDQRAQLPAERTTAIDTALRHYMNRQLKWEVSTLAKPMFAQITSGNE